MKRICLLIGLVLFCNELYSQSRIDDFYSLMVSSNAEKRNEVTTFLKTEDDVITTVENKRNIRFRGDFWRDYWGRAGLRIDSLDVVDYIRDTVFVFREYYGDSPFQPHMLIITDRNRIIVGGGSVQHLDDSDGWYNGGWGGGSFHPIFTEAVLKWDMNAIRDAISRYGTKPGDLSGPVWIIVSRIIIDNNKKVATSEIHLDGMNFMGLRKP